MDRDTIAQEARRHSRRPRKLGAAGAALSRRTVRRPAAARRAGPRADRRAGDAAARRAAVQSRCQPARGDALRGAPPARRLSLHYGLRHARSVRGDDDCRPDRGDERRQGRASRLAGGDLRPAAFGVRRALHRLEQRHQGQGARCDACRLCRRMPLRCMRRDNQERRSDAGVGPPARHRDLGSAAGRAKTSFRPQWCGRSFSAPAGTIWSRPRTARSCAYLLVRTRTSSRAVPSGCTCRRSAAALWQNDEIEGRDDKNRAWRIVQ